MKTPHSQRILSFVGAAIVTIIAAYLRLRALGYPLLLNPVVGQLAGVLCLRAQIFGRFCAINWPLAGGNHPIAPEQLCVRFLYLVE